MIRLLVSKGRASDEAGAIHTRGLSRYYGDGNGVWRVKHSASPAAVQYLSDTGCECSGDSRGSGAVNDGGVAGSRIESDSGLGAKPHSDFDS